MSMIALARYACHGLGVLQPIDMLAADLNRLGGPPFNIVGGFNPPLEQSAITARLRADVEAGKQIVWIGHSMGAALGYYLARAHPKWPFRLMITVDPMNWASNINCSEWQTSPPHPGWWAATGNYIRWINIHSDMPPGAGILTNKDANGCEDHHFPQATHIGIIAMPEVRKIIFDAVADVMR